MTVKISQTADVQRFFEEASGQLNERGDPRTKALVRRILDDTAKLIEEMQVTPDEFWKAVDYLNRLGSRQEAGLLAAGLGLEHYLDLLLDAQDAEAGLTGGTPRTIEGPLYVAGAPLSDGEARMDDGRDAGTVMFLQGRVSGPDGQPLAGAIVDVWHANTQGTYSYFDSSQSEYNLRRRIRTDADGRYRARSIVPSGYGCPSDGPTQELLDRLGRHGQRPAHIHFFVSAPGHRHLTTQINLAGDRYLWDDFAYATRDGLIGDLRFNDDPPRPATAAWRADASPNWISTSSSRPARHPPPSAAASGRGHCRGKAGSGEGGWSLATMPPSSARRDGG
ncbi:catechol 1,2-dioxygenase [Pseudomonas aeruginosa]|nr:catechol 1,2-dioxygenase [Pseudomonas aeruginosa]